ncbi:MAG: hypothetical protein ACYSUY_04155 [Planctomycetota bacterium]|jgi:hypothetical protein
MSPNQKPLIIVGTLLAFIIIVGGGIFALYCFNKGTHTESIRQLHHDQIAGPPVLKAKATELQRTYITPHLEHKIKKGKNVLWCTTFQIAWNELCKLNGEPIQMANAPEMVSILNKQSVTRTDLDEASYIAMAGIKGDGIIARIETALEEKFHGQASPNVVLPILQQIPAGFWITYCYLFKHLSFRRDFDRLPQGLNFSRDKVQCFGFDSKWKQHTFGLVSQVSVRDYINPDDFIIELITQSRTDRLILAKINPETTLSQTIEAVQKRLTNGKRAPIVFQSSLMVPVLNFDLLRNFTELYDKPIRSNNPNIAGTPFVLALQQIRFRLDEKGAVLKSEAGGAGGTGPPKPRPLNLIFNKPFLIMIKRTDAEMPYFVLWVDNTELLVPFE